MSRKRTKQYLMLLMVVGLVSIAAGGSGTFASFSAETTNAGNYFSTGTLVLNDNGGNNTCTSATATGTVNTANSSSTDCDTLFKVKQFQFANSTIASGTLDNSTPDGAFTTFNNTTGAAIYPGDSLVIAKADGSYSDTVTASAYTAVGGSSISANWSSLTALHSYTTGDTIRDKSDTQFAQLTLTNAGSINANGIKFKAGNGCTPQYTEPNTTLDMGNSNSAGDPSGTTLTIADTSPNFFKAGDTLIISENNHANSFIVATDQTVGTSVDVTASQPFNYGYDTSAVVSGPEFNGAGNANAHSLCAHLKFSIIQTSSGFNEDLSSASSCAYGSNSAPLAHASACNLNSTALGSVPTSSWTSLGINTTDGTNTANQLDAGKSRTFLLAVHYDGVSDFDNTYQNTEAAAFDLTWHIDQV